MTSGARIVRHPYNKGNGAAVKTGIREATGRFVLILDADGQHPPSEAIRLVSHLDTYDLVVGARSSQTQAGATRRMGNAAELDRDLPDRTANSRSHPGFRAARRECRSSFSPAAERLLHADDTTLAS